MASDLDLDAYPDLSAPPIEFGKALPVEETTTLERRPTSSLPSLPLKAPVTTSEPVIPSQTRDSLSEPDFIPAENNDT
ncbi:hypothetical protein QFC19_001452 [Naganishia cerealis]|uniref:Uncharacterized protein n=1 Tax=Naganishia cerealis TaxID=610337 RepID=A0ACC2WGN1_9TREE|nr:hypothetical protein QFC19_001452 [Naganishia cerealis]